MASLIADDLSELNSEQFDDLPEAQHDREVAAERALEEIDESGKKKKHGGRSQVRSEWDHAREPLDGEPARNIHHQRIFYCGHKTRTGRVCKWDSANLDRARQHLASKHQVHIDPGEGYPNKRIKVSIDDQLRQQAAAQQGRNIAQERMLKGVIEMNKPQIEEAWNRLIAVRNLPISCVEWPELIDLILLINPMAKKAIPANRCIASKSIKNSFDSHKRSLVKRLKKARSKLHFAIDIWSSPTCTNLQAIVCHFVDGVDSRVNKALLGLPEHRKGHGGEEQAEAFVKVASELEINAEQIGHFVGDNHESNKKMIKFIKKTFKKLPKVDHLRIRCLGHIINLAVHAFLYKRDDEAVELSHRIHNWEDLNVTDLANVLMPKAIDDDDTEHSVEFWRKYGPIGKLYNIVKFIRSSNARYQAWKQLAGRQIPMANATRWNSWFVMLFTALKQRKNLNTFIDDFHEDLRNDIILHDEWLQLMEYKDFLLPFWQATKKAEGDKSSLEEVLLTMDFLIKHFQNAKLKYVNSTATRARIITSWRSFDKYYNLTDQVPAYAVAILLHPSLRKGYIEEAWADLPAQGDDYCLDYVTNALENARSLWRPYKPKDSASTSQDLRSMSAYEQYRFKALNRAAHSDEFEQFIKADPISIKCTPLEWWLEPTQQATYPQLSKLAIDIFSIPPMSAEPERIFSGSRRQVDWSRCSLKASTIEQLECLKQWFRSGITAKFDNESISEEDETTGEDRVAGTQPQVRWELAHEAAAAEDEVERLAAKEIPLEGEDLDGNSSPQRPQSSQSDAQSNDDELPDV